MTPVYNGTAMEVKNISHHYTTGGLVLRDVNMFVPNIVGDGQVIGSLGRSGRGKTTLLKIIAGLLQPTSGEVLIGNPLRPTASGDVGVVWQNTTLMEHVSVIENLVFAAMRRNGLTKKQAHERSMEMLKRFSLDEHAHKMPDEISGGQRRRVAILQQVLCTAQVGSFTLLLDEPFTGLDEVSKRNVCELIIECSKLDEFATIWVVSHDISETLAVSDHAFLLGWEYDEKGDPIEGATVLKYYDVANNGLVWRDQGIFFKPEFVHLCNTIIEDIKYDNPSTRKRQM
jgi:ABC-type nitrate/sulfonate/bicarbonate transport system ATPase subunit